MAAMSKEERRAFLDGPRSSGWRRPKGTSLSEGFGEVDRGQDAEKKRADLDRVLGGGTLRRLDRHRTGPRSTSV